MHKPLSNIRKKKVPIHLETLPAIPFSQRFQGKISQVSRAGLQDVLNVSRELETRESGENVVATGRAEHG